MLWQLLLASILSAIFTVRYFFQRIKSKVFRVKSAHDGNDAKPVMRDNQHGSE
jgi:hypothetical protein